MSPSPEIGIAHPWQVDGMWPQLREGMARACETGRGFVPGQLWQMCRSGQAFLIVTHQDGVILMASIWQFQPYEGRTTFHCIALYGSHMRRWLRPAAAFVRHFAKQDGAELLTFCGRSKWARLFDAVQRGEYYEVAING